MCVFLNDITLGAWVKIQYIFIHWIGLENSFWTKLERSTEDFMWVLHDKTIEWKAGQFASKTLEFVSFNLQSYFEEMQKLLIVDVHNFCSFRCCNPNSISVALRHCTRGYYKIFRHEYLTLIYLVCWREQRNRIPIRVMFISHMDNSLNSITIFYALLRFWFHLKRLTAQNNLSSRHISTHYYSIDWPVLCGLYVPYITIKAINQIWYL